MTRPKSDSAQLQPAPEILQGPVQAVSSEGNAPLPYYSEPLLAEIDRLNQENSKLHALATLSAVAAAQANEALENSFRARLGGALIDAARNPRKTGALIRVLLDERNAKKKRKIKRAKRAASRKTPNPEQLAGHPDERAWLPRLPELVTEKGGNAVVLEVKRAVSSPQVLARLLAEIAILEMDRNLASALQIAEHAASFNPGEVRLGWLCLALRSQNRDEELARLKARLNGAFPPELSKALQHE